MKKLLSTVLILQFIIFSCQKNDAPAQDKKFNAVVLGQESTCYSWMIKFDNNRKDINTIMGKDSSAGGSYGVIHLPDSLKIAGVSFTASIRPATEVETGKIACNTMGLPPKWIVLTSISNEKIPTR